MRRSRGTWTSLSSLWKQGADFLHPPYKLWHPTFLNVLPCLWKTRLPAYRRSPVLCSLKLFSCIFQAVKSLLTCRCCFLNLSSSHFVSHFSFPPFFQPASCGGYLEGVLKIDGTKKDLYYDIRHNKSLAISFDTDTSRYRLTISNPFISERSATPFRLLV